MSAVLSDLGIVLRHTNPGEHRTACPECAKVKARRRDDALAVKIEPDAAATWCCHRCSWRGAVASAGRAVVSRAGRGAVVRERPAGDQDGALDLWRSSRPISDGTVAAAYLRARGCALPHPDGDLRYLEQHRHPSGYVGPALVALATHVWTAEPATLHRTWIRPDGTKAPIDKPRLLWPGLPKLGSVVRLWPDAEIGLGLLIGEGIESTLAAALGFGLGWVCMDAGNLAELPVLPSIEALTIVVDNDLAGISAAKSCAERWFATGVEVRRWMAPAVGKDFADFARDSA